MSAIVMKPGYFEWMGYVDHVEQRANGRLLKLTVRNVSPNGVHENTRIVDLWDRLDLLEDLQTPGVIIEVTGTFRSSTYTSKFDGREMLSQDDRVDRVVRILLPEEAEAEAKPKKKVKAAKS